MRLLRTWRAALLGALLIGIGVPAMSACTVRFISTYDEQVDQSATRLQKQLDTFLTRLAAAEGTDAATYAANRQFYDDYGVELRALEVRARSIPKNDLTIRQIELMQRSLADLREAHEDAPLSAGAIDATRDLFAQSWRAILTLELAKKRGEAR